jgi:hypothetical protein
VKEILLVSLALLACSAKTFPKALKSYSWKTVKKAQKIEFPSINENYQVVRLLSNLNKNKDKNKAGLQIDYEISTSPWNKESYLLNLSIMAPVPPTPEKKNIVLFIDVSASMYSSLGPFIKGFIPIVRSLTSSDRLTIFSYYGGHSELVLDTVRGTEKEKIYGALANLRPNRCTIKEDALSLAIKKAKKSFIKDGLNKVVIVSDRNYNYKSLEPRSRTKYYLDNPGESSLKKKIKKNNKVSDIQLVVMSYSNQNKISIEHYQRKYGNGNIFFIRPNSRLEKPHEYLRNSISWGKSKVSKQVKTYISFNHAHIEKIRFLPPHQNKAISLPSVQSNKNKVAFGKRYFYLIEFKLKNNSKKSSFKISIGEITSFYQQENRNIKEKRNIQLEVKSFDNLKYYHQYDIYSSSHRILYDNFPADIEDRNNFNKAWLVNNLRYHPPYDPQNFSERLLYEIQEREGKGAL